MTLEERFGMSPKRRAEDYRHNTECRTCGVVVTVEFQPLHHEWHKLQEQSQGSGEGSKS